MRGRVLLPLAGAATVAVAVAGFIVGTGWATVSPSELATLRPTVPTTGVAPSPSVEDAGREALSRTVTIEVLTGGDERFGTGWLYDARGDFVTNAHVVAGYKSVRLRDRSGNTHVGAVMGSDARADIAVVRSVDGFAASPLTVGGAATAVTVGERLVAVASSRATGHPDVTAVTVDRLGASVSTGTATGGDRGAYATMIAVVGAVIYEGNSGGPLLTGSGVVVGVVTLASRSEPEAFAIPIARVATEIREFAARS